MTESLRVSFPGGKRVDIQVGYFTIHTDQSRNYGGDESAPEPFDLFLSSLASCAGIFALNFCQSRDLSTDGLELQMEWEKDTAPPHAAKVAYRLTLPARFPDKYRSSILKAIDLCTVKYYIMNPPEFTIELVE